MGNMKPLPGHTLAFFSFIFSLSIMAEPVDITRPKAAPLIRVEASQQQALGLSSDTIEAVDYSWSNTFPAKVVVPNAQLRVVATPLGGLLESLLVSEGETVKKGQLVAIVHSQELLEKQSDYLDALTELNLYAAVRGQELLEKQSEYLDALTELNLYSAVRGQQLLQQQSDYLESLVELNLAATEMQRDRKLSKKGVISVQRFQESTAKFRQLKTRVQQFKQALALAGMSPAAIDKLTKTKKLAPYSISRNVNTHGARSQESSVKYQQLQTRVERYKQALELAGMSQKAIKQLAQNQKLVVYDQILRDDKKQGKITNARKTYQVSLVKFRQLKNRVEHYRQVLILAGMNSQAIQILNQQHIMSPKLEVRSPLDGVVLEQMVTPGRQLETLAPIYKVGYLKPLWLEIHVPLDKLGDVKKNTRVKVVEAALDGRVITVGRMVHGADQGVLIRAAVKEGTDKLRPGQFVQARIASSGAQARSRFRIPRSALVRNEGGTWIFIKQSGGYQPVPIHIEKEEADTLVISGDLSTQVKVVVSGTAALKAIWLEGAE